MVRYFIERPSALKRYAIRFLLDTAGYHAQEVSDAASAELYYGNAPAQSNAIVILDRWDAAGEPVGPSSADIIYATAALLTDRVNSDRNTWDAHDRITFSDCYQAQAAVGAGPVVSRYVYDLKQRLNPLVGEGIPLWPKGKRAALALSHDVDRLDKWSEVRGTLRTRRYLGDAVRSIVRNTMYSKGDPLLFKQVVDYEQSLGVKSAFLFASTSRYDCGASPNDVEYSIDSRAVREAMDYAQSRGFEIALHASYNAYLSAERFAQERERLGKAAGTTVKGLRHHYWHMGRDTDRTLTYHEQAGFTYDSSVAWNEHVGFRRNTASPYFPWNSTEQREIRVMQLPVCAMDGAVFSAGASAESALEQLLSVVNQVIDCEGLGVIDWHSDASNPQTPRYESWGTTYSAFLREVSQTPGLWITSPGEICDWLQTRHRALTRWTNADCAISHREAVR